MIIMGLVLHPSYARGGFVNIMSGYDLLTTAGGFFDLDGLGPLSPIPIVGLPLGTYNFGSGSVNVGTTDTIVHRLDPVTNLADGASQTIDVKMVALSLRSQFQIDVSAFGGIANEYVKTVNVQDLGSTMTITNSLDDLLPPAEGGPFDVTIKMSYQLQGVTSGVILGTFSKTLLSLSGSSLWTQLPNNSPTLIDGVNNKLNGLDHSNDFFSGFITLDDTVSGGGSHIISPEPTSLFAIGLACFAAGGRFARKRRLQQAS